MANQFRDVHLPVRADHTLTLVRTSGNEIPKFQTTMENPALYRICWHKGFGWTNPVDVRASVHQLDANTSLVRYEAEILALVDPFGFLTKTLDQFEQHLHAHHQAWINNTPPPPPPPDQSARATMILLGVVLGGLALMGLVILLLVIMSG